MARARSPARALQLGNLELSIENTSCRIRIYVCKSRQSIPGNMPMTQKKALPKPAGHELN